MGKGDIKTKRGKISNGTFGARRKRKPNQIIRNVKKECIFCGVSLMRKKESLKIQKVSKKYPERGETKDHIPQQCLFEGYPSSYKTNRLTVPSCSKCNFEFSKVENELRDLIGVANEKDDLQNVLTEKSVKSILKRKDGIQRLEIDNTGSVKGVEFNLDKLLPSHVKNFKGIFFKTFNARFPDSFSFHVLDKKLNSNMEELALDFLDKNCSWKYSGHEDIFKFKIGLIKPDKTGLLVPAPNINEAVGSVCQLVYHQRFKISIIAFRKTILKKRI